MEFTTASVEPARIAKREVNELGRAQTLPIAKGQECDQSNLQVSQLYMQGTRSVGEGLARA